MLPTVLPFAGYIALYILCKLHSMFCIFVSVATLVYIHHIHWGKCLWKWFENYFTSHQQCTAVRSSVSKLLPVLAVVPQGSTLGSLLFSVICACANVCRAKNQSGHGWTSRRGCYGPDIYQWFAISSTSLHFMSFCWWQQCAKSVTSEIEHQLRQNSLNSWSHKWNLPFNDIKFRFLHFSSKLGLQEANM